ncbi:hypothetical protein O5819_27505, partial [Escherichia coli]|nr:hypothetical protein [Escherichia coli]
PLSLLIGLRFSRGRRRGGMVITRTMFWRGCSERHGTDKTEFLWQSSDGSEVTAQVLPLGYAIGKYLPADENGLRKRLDS